MNEKLKDECQKNNIPFFDIYDIISDNNKFKKNICDNDGNHIDRDNYELRIIIESKLIETIKKFYENT